MPVCSRQLQGQYHCGGEPQTVAEDPSGEIRKSDALHTNIVDNYELKI